MDVKTLKEARYEIMRLEAALKNQSIRLAHAQMEQANAEEERDEALARFNAVRDHARAVEDYETVVDLLSDYRVFGWTDRLDAALRMAG